ncbi:hypothetical protein [Streptomyces sp. NPDC001450]
MASTWSSSWPAAASISSSKGGGNTQQGGDVPAVHNVVDPALGRALLVLTNREVDQ